MPRSATVGLVLSVAAIAGLIGFVTSDSGYQVRAPGESTVVIHDEEAAGLALNASRALYERAPLAVLAEAENYAAQAPAASAAVSLGAPLLLTRSREDPSELSDELERLQTESVLAFGAEPAVWAESTLELDVFMAPRGQDDLESATGRSLGEPSAVRPAKLTDAVASLNDDEPRLLALGSGPDRQGNEDSPALEGETGGQVPTHEPSRELDSLTFLVNRGRTSAAAAATARAAGARVIVTNNGDPRADPGAVAAVSEEPPEKVVAALDRGSDSAERLRSRLELAATGIQLPGGGQVLFPFRRMVALYGHPEAPELGALGEQPRRQTIERAKSLASEYQPHSNVAVIPALEIIATIASESPGDEGAYSIVTPADELRPWIHAARRAGVYVVLDLQPGRTDFLTQARQYEELLTEPHVGLALDPEWRLEDNQVHLTQIGSVDAQEINEVIDWLAALTKEHKLPQKLLLLHQFDLSMITDRGQVVTEHDELAVLLHADGHGSPELKRSTWDLLTTAEAPRGMWWGWKNFYDEDAPMWTPEQTMEMRPPPYFISYQ